MSNDRFISTMMPLVRSNRPYMEIVLKLGRVVPHLKRAVAASFLEQLSHDLELANPGWVVDNQLSTFDKRFECFSFRKDTWPKSWGIGMEMEQSGFRDFLIGFYCPSKTAHLQWWGASQSEFLASDKHRAVIMNALQHPLVSIGHNVRHSEQWPAYCWLPAQFKNWEGETFLFLAGLEQMPDGRTALKTFVDWFQILVDSLGTTVDEILMQGTNEQ